MSEKIDNRYLNLAGAPWTPTNPDQGLMLANYFAAAATTLCIWGAAVSNPNISGKAASLLASEAVIVSLGVSFLQVRSRRVQAKKITNHPSLYVIDTQPDNNTAPTSSTILGKINEQLETYKKSDQALIYGMAAATPIMAGFISRSSPDSLIHNAIFAAMMPLLTVASLDIGVRHRQFQKIADLKWVISDRGDAVGKFQDAERDKLANDKQVARVTASPPTQNGPR